MLEKTIFILMILVVLSINIGFAGDSVSLSVSCTIPAIPGVNAPLVEEEIVETETKEVAPAETKSDQEETKIASTLVIQQDSRKQISLSEGKGPYIEVETIYSR